MTFQEWLANQTNPPTDAATLNMLVDAFCVGKSHAAPLIKNAARYEAMRTLNCLEPDKFDAVIPLICEIDDGTLHGFDRFADELITALAEVGL